MSLFFRIFGWFPLPLLHAIGAFLGALVFFLSRRERRRALENLALVYPSGIPAGLALRSFQAAGRSLAELPYLWTRPIEDVVAHVDGVEGWDLVESARSRGESLLILTPHIGSFEVVGQYCGIRFPFICLYRPPKKKGLESVMVSGRTRGGMSLAATNNAGVKILLKALRQGGAIGLLPDQVPQSGEGIWAPYFGKLAYTMTLAARFAVMPKVTTLYVYATRESFGRYRIHVRPPAESWSDDQEVRVGQLNRDIERIVQSAPAQYFWAYNRYKSPHAEAGAELLAKEGIR